MTRSYEVAWRCKVEVDTPREALNAAKAELRLLLDSDAPVSFDWVALDNGMLATGNVVSVLLPDGSIRSQTGRRL